jgi:hypothetical protein
MRNNAVPDSEIAAERVGKNQGRLTFRPFHSNMLNDAVCPYKHRNPSCSYHISFNFVLEVSSKGGPQGSSRFMVRDESNVEPGTLNFEHPSALAPPSSSFEIDDVLWFFTWMTTPSQPLAG